MTKSIAELLVETAGRLSAAMIVKGRGADRIDQIPLAARDIVAEVYGPPCDEAMAAYLDEWLPLPEESPPWTECNRCGWPESQHPEKSNA